jgi:hypothetical protein
MNWMSFEAANAERRPAETTQLIPTIRHLIEAMAAGIVHRDIERVANPLQLRWNTILDTIHLQEVRMAARSEVQP